MDKKHDYPITMVVNNPLLVIEWNVGLVGWEIVLRIQANNFTSKEGIAIPIPGCQYEYLNH